MRNESVSILRIRGMNLFLYGEYAKRICSSTENEINLRTKFHCSYIENTRNESLFILRISRMNLFIYQDYVEQICRYIENTRTARKVEYLGDFKTKIKNIGHLLGTLMGLIGQII